MDTRQLLRQLRWLAARATWSDGGGAEPVFASVLVSPAEPDRAVPPTALPAVWLQPLGHERNAAAAGEAGLRPLTIRAHIFAAHRADPRGGAAILGGRSSAGAVATSPRVGLAVLALQLEDALGTLTAEDGVDTLVCLADGPRFHAPRADSAPLRATLDLLAWHAGTATFPPPRELAATPGPGSGEITLTWTPPAARVDLADTVTLRRKQGAPPAHPEDGDEVAVPPGVTTHVDAGLTPGVAVHYRLWAHYNDADEGAVEALVLSDDGPTASATPS